MSGDDVTITRQADSSLVIHPALRLETMLRTLEPLDAQDVLDDVPDLEAGDIVLAWPST